MSQGLGQTGHILIAEDNKSIAEPLARVLRRSRFQVDVAPDGLVALQKLAAHTPDLLLLDLQLPKLHGIDLLKKLRQSPKTRHLPVVVITGVYRGEKHALAARKLGVQNYLEKPFRIGDLVEAIQVALQQAELKNAKTLDQHLAALFLEDYSGRFVVEHDGRSHQIDFHHGRPVSLAPGFVSRDLGDFLLRQKIISAEANDYFHQQGGMRAESLVELGELRHTDLQAEKLSFLGDELLTGMSLGTMVGERSEGGLPDTWNPPLLNLPRLLHACYRRQRQPELRKRLLEQHGRRYAGLGKNYFRFINYLDLNEDERRLLTRLDGQSLLMDVLHGMNEADGLFRTLITLHILRLKNEPFSMPESHFGLQPRLFNEPWVEEDEEVVESFVNFADVVGDADDEGEDFAGSPAATSRETGAPVDLNTRVRETHAALQKKDYYQVFNLDRGSFSIILLKERYFEYTHQFGPEALMQLGGEEAELAQEILSLVSNAYNTLSNVVKKERYDELLGAEKIGLDQEGDDVFQAQVQFQSGMVFLEMEEWDNAEHALQDASNIEPNNGLYLAHLAWSIYKNPKYLDSQAMQNKAKQMLAKAISLERTAEAFAFKGWMLLDSGQETLAQSEFSKALKLNARQALARKGLRLLEEKREQDKKGLFSRMFRG
ncbi:MAG: response regulator [Desulfuromonas sp.]|nr:MAG: response regulator [Desulfuromonas sp.]